MSLQGDFLRKYRIKVTSARARILRVLQEHDAQLEPGEIHVLLRSKGVEISLTTIRAVIRKFEAVGILKDAVKS